MTIINKYLGVRVLVLSKNTPAFRLKRERQAVWDNVPITGKEGHADQTFSLIYQRESKEEWAASRIF